MSEQKHKSYRYYEGICSTKDIVKELAKVLSIGVRSNEVKDIDGNVLLEPFILQSKNWDIVYPAPDSSLNIDLDNMTSDEYKSKILNQVNQISDTVILKTSTTPVDVNQKGDDLVEDNDSLKKSLTMYLELYKPTYVANPEEYPLDCEKEGLIPKVITKDMHKESLSVTKKIEEVITVGGNDVCTISNTSTTKKDIIEYNSTSQCSFIVSKIINIYGANAEAEGFYMPGIVGSSTNNLMFDKTKLLEIKAKDNELYNTIRETLNVDDNEFQAFTSLIFNVKYENVNHFILSIEAITNKEIYTVSGTYILKDSSPIDTIVTKVVPEYYIDGAYIPLDKSLWSYDPTVLNQRGILFSQPITGDRATTGEIVLRYNIARTADNNPTERGFMLNNHYMLVRLFDEINEEGNGPSETTYNNNGEVVVQRAHISDWSKLSWYQDFEEVYQDEIDADSSTDSISDGTLLIPLETAGLNGETKIRYWLNTNNDRFNLIIMGNPSLDFKSDRHIISACYCGKIDSFDYSINDTAGNFALFVSSSTEPCKTKLTKEKTYKSIEYVGNDFSGTEFKNFLNNAYSVRCASNTTEYYVQIPDGRYFNKSLWLKYIVLDSNNIPVTDMQTVYQINYVEDNQAVISIHQPHDETHTLYIGYYYYEEKIVLEGGVQRDVFGNVLEVEKTDTFGANTSDGVTSVMMYHTQSKAYYQKHHMMFTTTEEYMSKVMYGKSSYTGEYYADRIKITHGNDGPRGMLNDMLVIDSASLYPFDELVINKDFEKDAEEYEETYVYFPITAPFSPLSDSPNARYGLAIKKTEVEPDFTNEKKIVEIAIDELQLIGKESWWGINNNIYPLGKTSNGSTVLWEVVPDSEWINNQEEETDYQSIELKVVSTGHKGDKDTPLSHKNINKQYIKATTDKDYVGSKLKSVINIDTNGFNMEDESNEIYFGVVNSIPKINKGATIQVKTQVVDKSDSSNNKEYLYGVEGVPFCGIIAGVGERDIVLKNAKPSDYLIMYEVKTGEKDLIQSFGVFKLDQDLIKYPSEVKVSIVKGSGLLETSPISTINYGESTTAIIKPDAGWSLESVLIKDSDGKEETIKDLQLTNGKYNIELEGITRDTNVSITFVSDAI